MKYFDTFTGIGGFTLAINNAYEIRNANRGENRGSKENSEGNKTQGFQSEKGQNTCTEKRPVGECPSNFSNERPLCVGYSEIDKYASSIYQKHYPEHKNYGDITKINAEELPDFDLLVGGFPCQAFSIAGKRAGFEDTRGTLFFDLARILQTKRPRLFVFENVKGLLSHDKGNTFKTIISTIDELGYDCQWQVLNSKNFGVPQNRERVFIIGHLRGTSRPEVFPITESAGKDIEQINNPTHSNDRVYGTAGVSPTLNTMQGGNRQPKIYDDYNSSWRKDDIAGTLTLNVGSKAERNGMKVDDGLKIRRLTPIECERLQGFPDNWTEGISDTQRYKCCGNAVTVNVVAHIMKYIV